MVLRVDTFPPGHAAPIMQESHAGYDEVRPMKRSTDSIGDRLAAAGKVCFVGRRAELALFERMLAAPLPPFVLLWFVGPGGIGKTTLLTQLRERASAAGRRVVRVDGATVDPTPRAFTEAVSPGLAGPDGEAGVLFLDTCERLAPLSVWLREEFLPSLPANWFVVCAGRHGADDAWRQDPRWATLLHQKELDELDDADSRALLAARGVAIEQQTRALKYARGHPLALSLMADVLHQAGGDVETPGGSSVVQTLVERFLRDVPDARHRQALRLAAFVRHTTESVLAAVLGAADAPALLDWMRRLGFMQIASAGLVPHELVRDVLVADALWRDPAGASTLVRAACAHFYDGIVHSSGTQRLHYQAEVLYVLRHQSHKEKFFDWSALGQHRVEVAHSEDEPLLAEIVRRHEGEAALPWLRYWWTRQREGFRLFRNAAGECDGFLLMLRIRADASAADRADPAVAAAWSFIAERRALAPAEELVLLRQWMHAEHYQAVTAAINLTAMHVVTHLITHPEAAWSAVYMADPDFWQPHFDGVNFARCPDADFTVGERRFGAFVHDWRFEPAPVWISGDYKPMQLDATSDDPAFVEVVRQALRDFTDSEALERSALARRLGLSGAALRERMREAVRQLATHPRDRKFERALWLTYIEPKQKQEQVAAELDIPFPTYRYRLQQAITRLAEILRPR
jgi:hypothetical protein